MNERTVIGGLSVVSELYRFVEEEALPGSGIDSAQFWAAAEGIMGDLTPGLRSLLDRRDQLQAQIDEYHRALPGLPDAAHYRRFLAESGYVEETPVAFRITTSRVDGEIVDQAGPQLVVPLLNARFAANAANARWGSLYDALYGTDAIDETGELAPGEGYNPARGEAVIARGRAFLDSATPLTAGSHADATRYTIDDDGLVVQLADGSDARLAHSGAFVGYSGDRTAPTAILLVNHGLHLEVQIDRRHAIGATDRAGVKDIVVEAALTTIMDLEDSVVAVDAADKTLGYRNWLLLNRGELEAVVEKGGRTFVRTMNPDRSYRRVNGDEVVLHGRSLMFVRHVGHHMFTDAILDANGDEVPEGFLDALVTTVAAMHDLRGEGRSRNSRTGSMYVVKPKQHGPDEVALTVELFRRVEEEFGLDHATIKIGIMDEERRTTVNLPGCIAAARDRVVFINTGFLDRTGDEIHTSLHAGPFVFKAELRGKGFLAAYEDFNVDVGLSAGFTRRAQIGKGMWAMPNRMAQMLEQKIAQPHAGATTAWVPSPTAAVLHALHYHEVDVFAVQDSLRGRRPTTIDPILEIPLAENTNWDRSAVSEELDNNVQSILGYVVRWVDQGIGCSTVPDIHDVGLMEDRATLRMSSQLLANWLHHGVISEADVLESLQRLAPVIDRQNANDPMYETLLGPDSTGHAFAAARDLILLGSVQPNGYTEPILHAARRAKKALRVTAR